MKFVSALGWMVLGLCLGAMLSRAISGPYPVTSHAYVQQHAIANVDADAGGKVAANSSAAGIDSDIDSNASH